MKPADLKPGHRIAHRVPNMDGTITVDLAFDTEPDTNNPGRTYVDIDCSDRSGRWTPDDLVLGTGAQSALWLSTTPTLKYRLVFLPDTDVEVEP